MVESGQLELVGVKQAWPHRLMARLQLASGQSVLAAVVDDMPMKKKKKGEKEKEK